MAYRRHRPSRRQAGPPSARSRWFLGVAALAAGSVVVIAVALSASRSDGSQPGGTDVALSSASPSVGLSLPPSAGVSSSDVPESAPSSAPPSTQPTAAVPIVPVEDYRGTVLSVDAQRVAAVLRGSDPRWTHLELVSNEADPILQALSSTPAAAGKRLITAASAAMLMADLAAHRDRLAFLRADEVGPDIPRNTRIGIPYCQIRPWRRPGNGNASDGGDRPWQIPHALDCGRVEFRRDWSRRRLRPH